MEHENEKTFDRQLDTTELSSTKTGKKVPTNSKPTNKPPFERFAILSQKKAFLAMVLSNKS